MVIIWEWRFGLEEKNWSFWKFSYYYRRKKKKLNLTGCRFRTLEIVRQMPSSSAFRCGHAWEGIERAKARSFLERRLCKSERLFFLFRNPIFFPSLLLGDDSFASSRSFGLRLGLPGWIYGLLSALGVMAMVKNGWASMIFVLRFQIGTKNESLFCKSAQRGKREKEKSN